MDIRKRPAVVMTSHGKEEGGVRDSDSSPTIDDAGSRFLVIPEVSNAVTDGYLMDTRHHEHPMNQYRIRRLTPLECERLQGFPDGWTAGASDTQRYRMMGNAVTVNVVEAIGRKMLKTL
jgi:site-specific DNA-cytosine methylase